MAEALLLKPDRKFAEEVIEAGGGDLKKCYQCATCSVVCGLSNEPSPFPRKEMIWAQWGLKDRLISDPDIWLCHQCNDCSLRCPRGARPGDVMAAVRQKAIEHYAFPSVMGRLVNSARAIPWMLVFVPAILIAAALLVRGPIESALNYTDPHGHEFYAHFFPHWLLIVFYSGLTLLTFAGLIVGLFRFWAGMKANDAALGRGAPILGFVPSTVKALSALLTHDRFGSCTDQASRKWSHLMAFYGFIALFVVTVWAVIDLYVMPLFGGEALYPFGFSDPREMPAKILANVGGVLLIVGAGRAILTRRNAPKDGYHQSTTFDWIFVWLLLLVGISGFIVEIFRFVAEGAAGAEAYDSGFAAPAYSFYFVHLVFVFGLLVYLPYSKFAHMWYRLAAMIYGEHTGRTGPGSRLVKVEGS
jgi:quinone-modifying oxidoreductase subunit QmoC